MDSMHEGTRITDETRCGFLVLPPEKGILCLTVMLPAVTGRHPTSPGDCSRKTSCDCVHEMTVSVVNACSKGPTKCNIGVLGFLFIQNFFLIWELRNVGFPQRYSKGYSKLLFLSISLNCAILFCSFWTDQIRKGLTRMQACHASCAACPCELAVQTYETKTELSQRAD